MKTNRTTASIKATRQPRRSILTTGIAALLAFASAATAATSTWSGGGGDNNWGTGANWDSAPNANDNLIFAGNTRLTPFNNSSPTTVGSITFDATAGSFTLGGVNTTITGGVTNNSTGVQGLSFAGGITLGGSQIWNAAAGALSVNTTVDLQANTLTFQGAANNTTISSSVSGIGGITVNTGSTSIFGGLVFMTGPGSSYSGLTTITSGGLTAGNASALGSTASGTTVASGADLAIDAGVTIGAEALSIAGTGLLTGSSVGEGALVFGTGGSGTSGYGGLITLTADATIGSNLAGTANITGGINNAGFNLTIGTNAYAGQSFTFNVSSVISGAGNLTVDKQTVTLTAQNTYLGSTNIINGGILNANSVVGALPAPASDGGAGTVRSHVLMDQTGSGSSKLNLGASQFILSLTGAATSTVNLNANNLTIGTTAGSTTFAGTISGTGQILKDGASTQVFTGQNTYTGFTTINGGVVQVGDGTTANSQLGPNLVFLNAGHLDINLADGGIFSNTVNTLTGTTVRAISANTNTIAGSILGTGGLEQNGTGKTILTNTNLYTGPTSVNAGTLQIGNEIGGSIQASSSVTVAVNATLAIDLVSNTTFGNAVTNNGTINTIYSGAAGTTNTLSGNITGTGGILQTGTRTTILSGNNSYTGSTVVNAGTLLAGSTTAFGTNSQTTVTSPGILDIGGFNNTIGALFGTGTVRNNGAAATLTVGGGDNSGNFLGVIQDGTSGTGGFSLVKTGTGNQALTGTNTFTGTLLVSNGVLQLNNASGTAIADTVAVTVTSPGVLALLAANETIGSIGGTGNVSLNTFTLTTGGNNNSTNLSGVISGVGGGLTKVGTGTMELSGGSANTFTGLTTVSAGTLSLNKSTGPALAGNVLINGTGTVTLLRNAQIANTATVTVDAGTFNVNGHNERIATLAGAGGTVNLPGGGLRIMNGSTTYSGNIVGTGTFRVTGGTQTLAGSNTYSGQTTISTATLKAASNTALSPNSNFNLGNLGLLDLNGTTNTIGALIGTDANASVTNSSATPAFLTVGNNNASGSYAGGINDGTSMVSLTKTGTGTQTLAGVNTFTGPATVNSGTLQVSGGLAIGDFTPVVVNSPGSFDVLSTELIGSLAGSGNVSLNANALIAGGNNSSTTFSGAITGAGGTFSKLGTGTMTLTGTSSYSGFTQLIGGTLAVGSTKALGNSSLIVTGGTLRNAGTPVQVNIGAGNISLNGGTAQFAVGGTAPGVSHDQITTTGTLGTITGKISLVQLNGYTLKPGDKVNLIVAGAVTGGSKTGTALSASLVDGLAQFSNTPLLIPVLNLYADPSLTLEAMQGSFAALKGQLNFTPNQTAVAQALDSLTAITGGKTGIFRELNFLDTQSLTTLAANLDKIAPEEFGTFFDISRSLARTQNRNVMQRTTDLQNQSAGGGTASGVAFRTGASGMGGASGGPVGAPSKEAAPAPAERWGLWMIGSGEFTRIGSTTNAAGYRYETGGVTAGLDYRFTDHFALGLSLGYTGTSATLANGGSLDVDGGRVGLYATWFDGGFHVDAAVSGGFNSYKTRRVTPNSTTASASPDGSEVNVLFATGYDWKVGSMKIGPTLSYEYTKSDVDGFTETGAFAPLRVRSSSGESSRTAVGIRASWETEIAGKRVRPELRAAWQHEFGDTSHTITSSFATLGGSAFSVTSPVTGRDSALLGAGVTILWNDTTAIYLNYDGEVGRKNYESHTVSGGLRLQF